MTRLLEGRSVLAVFPTGAGKSMCYQLPALLMNGLTLVVSPLIALMKDQIDFLKSKGVPAARLDSTVERTEALQTYSDLRDGTLKLLYIAPERLASERFLQTLRRVPISMMAVDEAHCISEWGHNFRPDYLKLAGLARELKVGRVLGLTATATPAVAKDIATAFGVADDDVVRTGFHRPNLELHVTSGAGNRDSILIERLRARPAGPTIVYVTLQKTAEQVAARLSESGFAARPYHAGLDAEERHSIQDWFMSSPTAIVAATIAFGMGIDKSDIRYIYHYNLPKTLENYAQEIGRSGRDGKPSICEVLADPSDRIVLENFTYGDTPTREAIDSFLQDVLSRGQTFDVSTYELSGNHDIRNLVVDTLLTYLELEGLIETTGPFYSEYKFQPLRTSKEMLARFDAPRAEFLRKVLTRAQRGKTWWKLDLQEIVNATGEPRSRIVAALNYLEEQGDMLLQMAGARQGYRLKRAPENMPALAEKLFERFLARERRDVERLQIVMNFTSFAGCRTKYLLNYFGEDLPNNCGHCDWCMGDRPTTSQNANTRPSASERDLSVLREVQSADHAALNSPRQLARFLCGLPSPSATRAKLTRHPKFGALGHIPFKSVLEACENAN